ncbi:MAG: hypothetical protein JWQ98_1964 [Chlorobi bacterium]|jgi:uncharacterized membrane protein YkvA (DUF1232 family)|nr:hypothetical protein [Chlorobiota bacterium]
MSIQIKREHVSLVARLRNLPRYLTDSRISIYKKVGIVLAVIYIVSPVDAIPDVIPVVGWLDDLGVLAILVGSLMRELDHYVMEDQGRLAK